MWNIWKKKIHVHIIFADHNVMAIFYYFAQKYLKAQGNFFEDWQQSIWGR